MFLGDTYSFARVLIVGTLAYLLVIFVLRITGKRSLSKMNSFDFIVTVALGSILASILTDENLALLDGVMAFSLLLFLQFITSWLSVRSDGQAILDDVQPVVLETDGTFSVIPKTDTPKAKDSFTSLEDVDSDRDHF